MRATIWQKPFALWVIAGGLLYMCLALLGLGLPFVLAGGLTGAGGALLAFLFIFVALFLIAAGFSLREKRWAYILAIASSVVLLILFRSFIIDSFQNPADSGFWLSASGIPALALVIIFAILSFIEGKAGPAQKRYLASPQSVGGLLTVGVIGFVIGSLVVGAIGAGVILRAISTAPADVEIVPGAASAAIAYSPPSFHVTLASGGKVTWINKDTTSHTVTSNQTGLFDSGTFGVGATWSYTFKTAGTHRYYCTIHPMMWGEVVVS
jgi:plastocyanin